jgi:hypothetical protein
MAEPPPVAVVAAKFYTGDIGGYVWRLDAVTPVATVAATIFPTSEDRLPVVLNKTAGQKPEMDAYNRGAETRPTQRSSTALDNPTDPPTGPLKLRAITATLQRNRLKTNASA